MDHRLLSRPSTVPLHYDTNEKTSAMVQCFGFDIVVLGLHYKSKSQVNSSIVFGRMQFEKIGNHSLHYEHT